jgi:hypothetical protein
MTLLDQSRNFVIARPKAVAIHTGVPREKWIAASPRRLSMSTHGNVGISRCFKRLMCGGRPICARLAP